MQIAHELKTTWSNENLNDVNVALNPLTQVIFGHRGPAVKVMCIATDSDYDEEGTTLFLLLLSGPRGGKTGRISRFSSS